MIEINNLTSFAVDKKFFIGLAKKVLKSENRERENLSIAFVSSVKIQKINKKYRKKNKPTDVLSFEKNPDFIKDINEVIICPAVIRKNALHYKTDFEKELEKILIHGILHILGYNHEKSEIEAVKMEEKERYYFSKIKNSKS